MVKVIIGLFKAELIQFSYSSVDNWQQENYCVFGYVGFKLVVEEVYLICVAVVGRGCFVRLLDILKDSAIYMTACMTLVETVLHVL